MVIRYVCVKCESILKVNDELAGSKGKCPKCKSVFVVPDANTEQPMAARPKAAPKVNTVDDDDLVYMPIDLTPDVDFSESEDFDPLDMLQAGDITGSARRADPIAAPDMSGTPKPSIAELMRDHEAAKQKKDQKKNKGSIVGAAAVASVMTAGTAADALTRSYDKKRGDASSPAPLTREEQRAAEHRQATQSFALKALAGIAGVLTVAYFIINWAFSEPLPDLEYVSGVVTMNNAPLAGVFVQFAPIPAPGSEENATPSTGLTDASGNYIMMYDPENEGVLPATHDITIYSSSGIPYGIPEQDRQKTVTAGGDNTFNFSL